ncbi:MAG: c-type cytochrome [Bryobacteraceae bacterium]|nr:c-type cytochrome [Bryobacteraceae bacterium]
MKKLLLFLLTPALLGGAAFAWLAHKRPEAVPPSNIQIERTPERVARGRYLFTQLADCDGCHSPRDWQRFAGPVIEAERGAGVEFPPELGLPGRIFTANLTSDPETGLGQWTDGEILRAIREGVSRDGTALFNFMPYDHFAGMSDEDAHALVAYIRTLPPVRRKQPRPDLDFPLNYLINDFPKPLAGPVPPPAKDDKVKYGEYLVNLALCKHCHTVFDKGAPVAGREFGGGQEFRIDSRLVRSANITPDEDTGIGRWTEERFIAKFKGFAEMHAGNAPKMTQANFTLMPWLALSRLPEDELSAIYAYLRSVKPIRNEVNVHPQPGTY